MRIFNSVGSNYTLADALWLLVRRGKNKDAEKLASFLAEKYGGDTQLYYRGRGALDSGLKAVGAPGKDVIITGFTCYAVEQAVAASGMKPVYADIAKTGFNPGLTNLKKAVTNNTAVVIIQNTYGITVDIEPIETYCRGNDIILVEDLAHCLGSFYADGREAGMVGDITMLSFGRDKHIDVVNGGAVIIRGKSLQLPSSPQEKASLVTRLRDRVYPIIAWKSRLLYSILPALKMGAIYSRIMRWSGLMRMASDGAVLDSVPMPNHKAKRVLQLYRQLDLSRLRKREITELYGMHVRDDENILRVPVLVKNRDKFLAEASREGFNLHDTWYDSPVYPSRYMAASTYVKGSCPNAESLVGKLVNLPVHKNISKKQAAKLSRIVSKYV